MYPWLVFFEGVIVVGSLASAGPRGGPARPRGGPARLHARFYKHSSKFSCLLNDSMRRKEQKSTVASLIICARLFLSPRYVANHFHTTVYTRGATLNESCRRSRPWLQVKAKARCNESRGARETVDSHARTRLFGPNDSVEIFSGQMWADKTLWCRMLLSIIHESKTEMIISSSNLAKGKKKKSFLSFDHTGVVFSL